MTTNRKELFAQHGITYAGGKIYNDFSDMWFTPMLVNGNSKLGKGVWTFSTLAGTREYTFTFNGMTYMEKGTCVCDCEDCYAQAGFYNMPSVIAANGIRTYIARHYPAWLHAAIVSQIKAFDIRFVRIHASGDFFSDEYIEMWKNICIECPDCTFWSYTKNERAEHAFDDIANCNIVKSLIPHIGFNFGECEYIMRTFETLRQRSESVYICRCSIDDNQHCNNCKGCSKNNYVLFLKHSTPDYDAKKDPFFPDIVKLVEAQPKQ